MSKAGKRELSRRGFLAAGSATLMGAGIACTASVSYTHLTLPTIYSV